MSRRRGIGIALLAAAALTLPQGAQAYWRGGVFYGFGPPAYYYPPPLYYAPPPPVVYAPPPVVYERAPAGGPAVPIGSCQAGAYVCPLNRPVGVGGPCSCPTEHGGRIGGLAR